MAAPPSLRQQRCVTMKKTGLPSEDVHSLLTRQQVYGQEKEIAKLRAADVSQSCCRVIPQVAFCLVSDSLRKGSNLITGGSTRRGEAACGDGCSGGQRAHVCAQIIALLTDCDQ